MQLSWFGLIWISIATNFFRGIHTEPIGTGGPSIVQEGADALLTCVIMGPYSNDTVIWRKGPREILSAGVNRVTSDKRISILHDESPKGRTPTGGDVWVLLLRDTRPSDTDVYVCEVNSDPALKSFHPLRVREATTISSANTNNNNKEFSDRDSDNLNNSSSSDSNKGSKSGGGKKPSDTVYKKATTPKASARDLESSTAYYLDDMVEGEMINEDSDSVQFIHDFSQCCQQSNVSESCMGYCAIHNIIDGTTGTEPETCEADFPSIVRCMADRRNHMPCCEAKGVPDLCQDMCRGDYTPFTDYLKSRVSCVAHTLPALQCILSGIQNIPSAPENVAVEPQSERSLLVSWSPPQKLASTVKYYRINVTVLHSFDQDYLANETASTMTVSVSGDLNSTVINDLQPFTMYTIVVSAHNDNGDSLPSLRLRALTLDSGVTKQTNIAVIPVLPDVRGCCIKNGISHRTCLDKMCDPQQADFTQVPDLMVCAPWANITFSCLANNVDHTPCCKARGIPEACLPFCAGTVTTINYNKFKCLQYMPDYSSCLFQGYGVLAGPPSRLKAPLISQHFAVLEWNPPKILPDTVMSYHLFIRRLGFGDDYNVVMENRSPIVLEDLKSGTYYEAFVVAVNAYGKGAPSPRIIFQTKHEIDNSLERGSFNMTTCCQASGLLPQCMPLCTYDVKMTDLQNLSGTCGPQVGVLAKCGAAGRDHTPCCSRRAVPSKCLALCHGVLPTQGTDCLPYAGNIIQCLEEGSGKIPGPVEDLKVLSVTNTSISLSWVPSEEDTNNTDAKVMDYLVQYGKVDNMTMYETIVKLENELNTTETDVDLTNLVAGALYRIVVVARGEHGSSLPSSMLLINTSKPIYNTEIYGAPSPPHTLAVSAHSASWITISWQPPEFSHPHEPISYRIYHKTTNSEAFVMTETRLLWTRLNNLKPNSQHIIFVTASGNKGVSLPSETLVAWTDPALPAHVDEPTINPSDMVAEGSSMTVLCLALGNPAPTISLYVGGHLVRQDTSRHMVTVIHNVTTDMDHVSCYADNGYGLPMQASKKVNISYAPRIQASGITVASLDEAVDLKCTVKARPAPKAMFWRDHDGRIPVIQGGNYDMTLTTDPEDPAMFTMTLHIGKLTSQDVGDYFCHAQNALGSGTRPVSVRMRNMPAVHNISECCIAQNVSSTCMAACSFYVDIDAVIDRPECLVDFDKLMKCAADGSDHRACCAQNDVPRRCLNWCRGEPIGHGSLCPFQYTKTIVGCFQSNRDLLPGPPQNLAVQIMSDNEVQVRWDPPLKNPQAVLGYKVYWHELDPNRMNLMNLNKSMGTTSLDAKETTVWISGLKQHVMYKLLVKAGNNHGASLLSDPLRFTLGDHHVTSASHSTSAGTISGILAGVFVIVLAIIAVLLFKRRKVAQKAANGVAFENPSYLREVNMEHVHIPAVSGNGNVTSSSPDWHNQEQSSHQTSPAAMNSDPNSVVPMATEVNPSLYEELKLRHEGAGFKRLVSS